MTEPMDHIDHRTTCESCIREAATKLGMIDPVWRDEAIVSMHELQRVADELLAERDEARMLVDLIRDRDEKHVPDDVTSDMPPDQPVSATCADSVPNAVHNGAAKNV